MGNLISHGLDAEGSRHVTSVRSGDATSKGGGSAAEGLFGSDVACLAPCAALVEGDTMATIVDSSAAHGLGQGATAGSVSSAAGYSAGLLVSASAVCSSSGVAAQSGQGMAGSSTLPTRACPDGVIWRTCPVAISICEQAPNLTNLHVVCYID